MSTAPEAHRKVSDVLQDIVGNIQQIIHSEFVLAKVEIKEKAQKASKPAAAMTMGTALALYGLGFLLLTAMFGLSRVVPHWLAAFIIGTVLGIAAAILVGTSRKALKEINPVPTKTVETIKENVQWAKDQIK